MASVTLNFSIGDITRPLRNTVNGITEQIRDSRHRFERGVVIFDQMMLRFTLLVLVFSTLILSILSLPYVFRIIRLLITGITENPRILTSLAQLLFLLPIILD